MMSEFQVRGYTIVNAVKYLKHALGEEGARQVFEGFSPGLQHALTSAAPADWVPVSHISEAHRAIAALGKGDEDRARNELITSGRWIANEATNTFLKLVMKVLTPALFAKKLPKLWSRDATCGRYEVDVTEDRLVCRLHEMEEIDHMAPSALGYVTFALEAMGKKIESSKLHGWSLAKPNASGAWFELYWK
jgi:hypothetical protein